MKRIISKIFVTALICLNCVTMIYAQDTAENLEDNTLLTEQENVELQEQISPEEEQVLPEEEQISPKEGLLEGKIILLDAGHGEGYNTYLDYCEGDNMLLLARKITPLLEAEGATVVEIRPDVINISLSERSAIINKISLEFLLEKLVQERLYYNDNKEILEEITNLIAQMDKVIENPSLAGEVFNSPYSSQNPITDTLKSVFELQNMYSDDFASRFLVISLHSNAASTEKPSGALAFYEVFDANDGGTYKYYRDYGYLEQEKAFSDIILDELEIFGFANAGTREENFHMLRENNMPTILVENGFHTNEQDREMLTGDENLNQIANAYYNTITKYYASEVVPDEPEIKEYTIFDTLSAENVAKNSNLLYSSATGNITGIIGSFLEIANKF